MDPNSKFLQVEKEGIKDANVTNLHVDKSGSENYNVTNLLTDAAQAARSSTPLPRGKDSPDIDVLSDLLADALEPTDPPAAACSACIRNSVQRPREQVADTEALMEIANSLVTSVKSQSSGGLTPSNFVNCLLKHFGSVVGSSSSGPENGDNSLCWKDVGLCLTYLLEISRVGTHRYQNVANKGHNSEKMY